MCIRDRNRAARGADTRTYPHGNTLLRDDANIDATYGRVPGTFGPDAVGSHPASNSPFGLRDMAGNAYEITRASTDDLIEEDPSAQSVSKVDGPKNETQSLSTVLRGGAYYYGTESSAISNRQAPSTQGDSMIGVRLCAPLPGNSQTNP